MPATIKIKNSSTASAVPTSSDLVQGELAVNVTDRRIFTENASGTVVELGTNPSILTLPDGSASAPTLTNDGDTNTGIFFPAADTVGITTGGSERLRVDSSGNLGVGVTPSGSYQLQAGSGSGAAGRGFNLMTLAGGYSGGDYPIFGYNFRTTTTGGSYLYNGSDVASAIGFSSVITFNTASSGTAGNSISFSERARIISSGYFKASNNGTYRGSTSTSHEFNNDVANNSVLIANATSTSFANTVFAVTANRNTTNGTFSAIEYYNDAAAAVRFKVADSGNVTNTNNSYGAISDSKLKENVTDATPKLDKLNQVRVVNYNLIGDANKQLGVIAQELEQIFPGMVEDTLDYEEVTVTDEEGNETTERVATGTTTKSVKYSVFVPMLIKALQEQQAIISSLTARIEALEA